MEAPHKNSPGEVRIVRAWLEGWEKKNISPSGDSNFEARVVRKYGGLKSLDPDSKLSLRVSHPERMTFTKAMGK